MRIGIRAVSGSALLFLAGVSIAGSANGQAGKIDTENVLTVRLGFSQAEVAQIRAGEVIVRLLPGREANDIGVVGAVRLQGTPDRLVYWLKEITNFRSAAELGTSGKLSSPPQIGDFANLVLGQEELQDLRQCRPGSCDLRLGDKAIGRFQTEVDWSAPDAARRANLLTRQLMLQLAQAYLRGGDVALGTANNERTPQIAVDEFRALLTQATNVYQLAPRLASYLERFPAVPLAGGEQFLYWAQGGGGPESAISLHQMVIDHSADGAVMVDKQIYSSRYTDAAIFVISLAPAPDGAGYYALVGGRARSRTLAGTTARLLRGRVESVTRDTAKMYLTWLQASVALSR